MKFKEYQFNEYQDKVKETAFYPNLGSNLTYPCLGIAGESGEICEKVKKIIRDKNGEVSEEDKILIKKEIGDVLFYLTALCWELGITLNDAAEANIEKIKTRLSNGTLKGSGDNR